MHNYLLLYPWKNQLVRRLDNNSDYKFIKSFTLIALHIEFALSLQIWEKVY